MTLYKSRHDGGKMGAMRRRLRLFDVTSSGKTIRGPWAFFVNWLRSSYPVASWPYTRGVWPQWEIAFQRETFSNPRNRWAPAEEEASPVVPVLRRFCSLTSVTTDAPALRLREVVELFLLFGDVLDALDDGATTGRRNTGLK